MNSWWFRYYVGESAVLVVAALAVISLVEILK